MVVSVGIDVSKDKHDCFILSSEGAVLADVFTIPNNMDGFNCLLQRIRNCTTYQDKIKVGLEATGHYSYNILGFLLRQRSGHLCLESLAHQSVPEKSQSEKDKDRSRGCTNDCSYASVRCGPQALHGHSIPQRGTKVTNQIPFRQGERTCQAEKLRLQTGLYPVPWLEKLVPTLHGASVYALLDEFPGAAQIAEAHLTRLKALLSSASRGRYGRDMAVEIRDAARRAYWLQNACQIPGIAAYHSAYPGTGC